MRCKDRRWGKTLPVHCLSKDQEGAAQVGGNDFIEQIEVILADGRKWHDPRVVNHNVDAPEFCTGFIEEPLDVSRARNICFDRNGVAANPFDFSHYSFGLVYIT